jgi:REP element-mobilizing transposase RayT
MKLPARQNRDRQEAATTYLITWACYGAWLPGQGGAVPRTQNRFGARLLEPDARREHLARNQMTQAPYLMDAVQRRLVLNSVQEVCSCRGWTLLAAHIRTNHVHVVSTANCKPERVMNAMKAYSSRALNKYELEGADRRRWARHGSTRYLWTRDAVQAAVHYVVWEQGEPMEVYGMPSPR